MRTSSEGMLGLALAMDFFGGFLLVVAADFLAAVFFAGVGFTAGCFAVVNLTADFFAVVDFAAGCGNSLSDTTHLFINPNPLVTTNTPAVSVFAGSSTTLTAYNAITYAWAPAAGLNTTTGATVIASPAVTTTYTVTGTNAYGCTNTATVLVTVDNVGIDEVNVDLADLNIYANHDRVDVTARRPQPEGHRHHSRVGNRSLAFHFARYRREASSGELALHIPAFEFTS